MSRFLPVAFLFALAATLGCAAAHAQKKTVCTITVNSADEKETFRARLPREEYEFVELVEKGRSDWLRSSCRKGVSCDVLVVSGHFNAGDTFYSDDISRDEHLAVDELERAACGSTCPALFSRLKEVYLFGCESLNPDATKYSSSFGESGRDRMRRIFAGVPVIYGFSSAAPTGPTAGALLRRAFDAGARQDIATGRPSSKLLAAFSRSSMTSVRGVDPAEASRRTQICQFFDDRLTPAGRLGMIHGLMKRDMNAARSYFPRIEKAIAATTEAERQETAFSQALAQVSADEGVRSEYLAAMRSARPWGTRARMIGLAGTFGWLSPEAQRAEALAVIRDLFAEPSMGFAEVDLACSLNQDHRLDGAVDRSRIAGTLRTAPAAVLACLGDREARSQVLQALTSTDARDVEVAQTYLRHRPIDDKGELRDVAARVARMPASDAKVRSLDALGRLNIADPVVLGELVRSFADATSASVQRAIAEVLIRSDTKAIATPDVVGVLQKSRLRTSARGDDLVDVMIRRLQAS